MTNIAVLWIQHTWIFRKSSTFVINCKRPQNIFCDDIFNQRNWQTVMYIFQGWVQFLCSSIHSFCLFPLELVQPILTTVFMNSFLHKINKNFKQPDIQASKLLICFGVDSSFRCLVVYLKERCLLLIKIIYNRSS